MSRHVVTLFKTQTSRSNTYLGHECTPYIFYCISSTVPCGYTGGVQDMKVGDHSCGFGCPTQNICLKPDRSEAYIGNSSKGHDPLITIVWDVKPPNLRCIYDLDHIDTPSQINALKRLFPHDQLDHVMRAFCTGTSNECPTAEKPCSKLKSTDEIGSMCREWINTLSTDEMRDSVRREYCLTHNTSDCRCINRVNQPDFIELRNGMDAQTLASTRCWYKPCEDNANILLDVEQKQVCTANICQNIINAHAKGNINISNNTSSLNCSFTNQQLAEANKERDKILHPQKHPSKDDKHPSKDDKHPTINWGDWIIKYKFIGIVCGLILGIALLLLIKRSK